MKKINFLIGLSLIFIKSNTKEICLDQSTIEPFLQEVYKSIDPSQVNLKQNNLNSNENSSNTKSIMEANNEFAIKLYSQIKDNNDKNILFSPFSISNAFAMVYDGARGKTAKQIESVFNFPNNNQVLRNEYQQTLSETNNSNKKYTLNVANALWVEATYTILDSYLNNIKKYYYGYAHNLNFRTNPEESRDEINDWVSDKTNQKIPELIPKGMINESIKLILTNAIYFKGKWENPFTKAWTKKEDFTLNDNSKIKVDMMNQRSHFNYMENEKVQILEIPYEGKELSMIFILPIENNLKMIEKELKNDVIDNWKKQLSNQELYVYIPKFKFKSNYEMSNELKKMGMPIAFQGGADFSGIDGTKNLQISNVIHKAFIESNEEGTEAAAATAVTFKAMFARPSEPEPKPKIFRADHPFIFLIQQNKTGNTLFMGRINNPNEQ